MKIAVTEVKHRWINGKGGFSLSSVQSHCRGNMQPVVSRQGTWQEEVVWRAHQGSEGAWVVTPSNLALSSP